MTFDHRKCHFSLKSKTIWKSRFLIWSLKNECQIYNMRQDVNKMDEFEVQNI